MISLNNIMIGSKDAKKLAKFYEQVFERPADSNEGDEWFGWNFGTFFVSFGPHSEVSSKAEDPKRIILNLETPEVKKEFERIKAIEGAEVIKEPYTMEGWEGYWIATLADPDGNYFQLMMPWESSQSEK